MILDDSQLVKQIRVPAWSPSMVVEDLQVANKARKRQRAKTKASGETRLESSDGSGSGKTDDYGDDDNDNVDDDDNDNELGDGDGNVEGQANKQEPREDLIDQHWTAGGASLEEEDGEQQLSKQQRRLLAKQRHFNQQRRPSQSSGQDEVGGQQAGEHVQARARRWMAVESKVDEQERVLSRIIAGDDSTEDNSNDCASQEEDGELTLRAENNPVPNQQVKPTTSNKDRLRVLRQMLFKRDNRVEQQQQQAVSSFGREHFKWPNKVQLSFDQYKILEEYLLSDNNLEPGKATSRSRRHSWLSQETEAQPEGVYRKDGQATKSGGGGGGGGENDKAKQLRDKLAATIRADPETSCAARSYYDHATIYTRGCQTAIENWIESSMNVLFVAGVCVLCFVKLCSLFMLRFEIREMIHKIRVLKGMATEYNALQDLEAYLPRPSVCAQAAELTPSGVTAAIPLGSTGGGSISGQSGIPMAQQQPPIHRLGGSFSEAVAAAAAAQSGCVSPTGRLGLGGLGGLASTGRAASMKAVAAMSCMLTPGLYPRSSSVSAAHLQAASWLSNIHQAGAGGSSGGVGVRKLSSLRSTDPFGTVTSPVVSRRHTAISVCPAAAANVAAAAAQHLMARRGTYVANPIFGHFGPLKAPGMNLAEHRLSAQLLSPPGTSGCAQNRMQARQYLTDIDRGRFEHQSSAESSNLVKQQQQQQCQMMVRSSQANTGSHQLLSLVYPFKRQSSGGAQSACNFSLDILPPGGLLESRRSIH